MGPHAFPIEEVHKISVLDIRLANADRHAGNILVYKDGEGGQFVLVPIDHGYCLPENVSKCYFVCCIPECEYCVYGFLFFVFLRC